VQLDGKNQRKRLCLMDIKEAAAPEAPHARGARMPADPAQRVVQGARCLSPSLGERMLASTLAGRAVFVRELRPQDLKVELDTVSMRVAVATAALLSEVLGRAHGSQISTALRKRWLRELKRASSRKLDAPSWLWSSVVELIGLHEQAYLQFCLRYARTTRRASP
jgi:uncharacterized protein (DUF2252 family)